MIYKISKQFKRILFIVINLFKLLSNSNRSVLKIISERFSAQFVVLFSYFVLYFKLNTFIIKVSWALQLVLANSDQETNTVTVIENLILYNFSIDNLLINDILKNLLEFLLKNYKINSEV